MSLGDGDNYQSYGVDVKNAGGQLTNWPFGWQGGTKSPYTGAPAARFPAATFQALVSSGVIDSSAPSGITSNGAYVYVLAPQSVVDSAPSSMQMTVAGQIEDFLFSDWGSAIAAFPGQLQQEIKGVTGYAGAIAGQILAAATGAVAAGAAPLLSAPVLIGGAIVVAIVALVAFRKK